MGTTESNPTSAAEQAASTAEGTTTPTNTAETEKVTESKTEAHTSSKEEPTFNKEGLLADLYKERSLRRQLRDKCAALETELSSRGHTASVRSARAIPITVWWRCV